MNWKSIKDQLPIDNSIILQYDRPCDDYSYIGFRTFRTEDFSKFLKYCIEYDIPKPDFWWVYKSEFPCPQDK